MKLNIGDVVILKKAHACGGKDWKILRVGMDFRLVCCKCGHQVWLPRTKLEKSIRQVRPVESEDEV